MRAMNCLTLDAHKQESIHFGATFSTPAFSAVAFLTIDVKNVLKLFKNVKNVKT